MAFEHSDQVVLGMTSSAPRDFEAWEKLAAPPEIYSPPQEAEHWFRKLVYKTLKSSCCGCVPPVRMCCSPCWPVQRVDITVSDEWLEQMLKVESNKNAPDSLSGAWWMQDNIAAENVLTFNDGEWASESVGKRISKYNWTIDAWNLWGLMLSNNSWTWGGEHVFEYSPDRKWIHITYGASSSSNWIYVIQPGDVFKTPDGQVIDVTPGEDMLRVSYETLDTKSKVTFQYWLRRIAYLDADGKLVKTPNYDKLMKAAESSTQFCGCCDCGDSKVGAMRRTQAFTIAPPQQVSMSTYEEVGTAV